MNSTNIVIGLPTGSPDISPIGFHIYASEFAKYAREAGSEVAGPFSPVPYYLYCHSLELVLKAFLLARGVAEADLKKRALGHDLSRILSKAQSLDLEQTISFKTGWAQQIGKANEYYAGKGFEYFCVGAAVRGYQDLPDLAVLNEIVTTLLERLEQTCLAA